MQNGPYSSDLAQTNNNTLLVVDHDIDLLRDVRAALAGHSNLHVQTAASVSEALELLDHFLPSLVVTDLRMPERDGLALVREVKNLDPTVGCVLMAAAGDEAAHHRALAAGCVSVLEKPFSIETFVKKVRRHLPDAAPGPKRENLAELLELYNLTGQTKTVFVEQDGISGRLAVVDGNITQAECGHLTGDAAIQQILSWTSPRVEPHARPKPSWSAPASSNLAATAASQPPSVGTPSQGAEAAVARLLQRIPGGVAAGLFSARSIQPLVVREFDRGPRTVSPHLTEAARAGHAAYSSVEALHPTHLLLRSGDHQYFVTYLDAGAWLVVAWQPAVGTEEAEQLCERETADVNTALGAPQQP